MGAWAGVSIGAAITAVVGVHDWRTAAFVSLGSLLTLVLDRRLK